MLTIPEGRHAKGADFSEAEDDNDAISLFVLGFGGVWGFCLFGLVCFLKHCICVKDKQKWIGCTLPL